jgi:SSS family solute:Na+ symporter
MHLNPIDYSILIIYTLFVLGIGFALKRFMKSSADFFMSGRAIPAWITGLAFISANLGAVELVGMGASGAKYGMLTCHFYWLGAIPAMIFMGLFMMPFYYGSKARSVPEYLKMRFDEKTRGFNAISFAVMTIFSSGISLHMLAKIIAPIIGVSYDQGLLIAAVIVLVYIYLGGLTSAIYNEVLQFFLIVVGFLPVVLLGLKDVGGWQGLVTKLNGVAAHATELGYTHDYPPGTWTRVWQPMMSPDNNPMGIELVGMVMGLGLVLAFGYWCTNFLVVQRAMAAESMSAARRTPLIGAVPKMLLPALVILPGMIALVVGSQKIDPKLPATRTASTLIDTETQTFGHGIIPPKYAEIKGDETIAVADKPFVFEKKNSQGNVTKYLVAHDKEGHVVLDYDMATPNMIAYYFPTGVLGLGLTALLASFMSGMAGNVTAFNTVWTYDIYQSYIAPNRSDKHYLWMGRVTTLAGTVLSIAAAYSVLRFNNIMDMLQLVFGFVNAPLFATFILGMFWKRSTSHAAFFGLLLGTLTSALHYGLTAPAGPLNLFKGGWLSYWLGQPPLHVYGKEMAQNFYMAMYSFLVCFVTTVVLSLLTRRDKSDEELRGLVYSLTPHLAQGEESLRWYQKPVNLALFVLAVTIVLNIMFW